MRKIKLRTVSAFVALSLIVATSGNVLAHTKLGTPPTTSGVESIVVNVLNSLWTWLTGALEPAQVRRGGGSDCPVRICGEIDPR